MTYIGSLTDYELNERHQALHETDEKWKTKEE